MKRIRAFLRGFADCLSWLFDDEPPCTIDRDGIENSGIDPDLQRPGISIDRPSITLPKEE